MLLNALPSLGATGAYGHGIDLLVLGFLAFGALQGGFRGLTGELARVAGLLVAVGVSLWLAAPLETYLAAWLPPERHVAWRGLATVCGLVLTATLAGRTVCWGVDRFLALLLDQPANAILGVLAGTVRAALWAVALMFLASFFAFGRFGQSLFEESLAGRTALPAVRRLRSQVAEAESSWPLPESGRMLLRSAAPEPSPEYP